MINTFEETGLLRREQMICETYVKTDYNQNKLT